MATSTYFSKFDQSNEQNLYEDLIIESIKIYGHDVYYIPRTLNNIDNIFGEDPISSFDASYPMEMYIKSVDGFQGEGDFVSKFGLEIRDQVVFSMSRRRFSYLNLSTRPKEGDLIYFPLTKKLFEIMFVEHEAFFYQTGRLQTYDITCELFSYNDENIDTGISDIDAVEVNNSYSRTFVLSSISGTFTKGEQILGSSSSKYSTIQDIDLSVPKIVVNNFTGDFTVGETLTGQTSSATATLSSITEDQYQFLNDSSAENKIIQTTAEGIIDFSETNPFSEGNY